MARNAHKARRKTRQLSSGSLRLTRRGYGFVDTPEGEFFILPSKLNGAMDGDYVEVVRLRSLEARRNQQRAETAGTARNSSREQLGAVKRVLVRKHQTIIGRLLIDQGIKVVQPLDPRIPYDIFIDPQLVSRPAQDADIVLVRLTSWPSRLTAASGYIEEVIGAAEQQGLDSELICRKYDIPCQFSAAALEAARELSDYVSAGSELVPSTAGASDVLSGQSAGESLEVRAQALVSKAVAQPEQLLQRRDLRDIVTFTIDPIDARDFDDALSVEYVNGELLLGVHIADVSAYVELFGAIDLEARQRACSVYLPDQVIAMLPEELSNDLCSLIPDQDRLAFSVLMTMNSDGSVADVQFFTSIIRSDCRLTYDAVDELLQGSASQPEISSAVAERLRILDRLARKLRRRRTARGAIDFDTEEAKLLLDDNDRPIAVELRRRTAATSLVEEAMILANEQVAQYMMQAEAPMVYRVHPDPLPLALSEVAKLLDLLGYLKSSNITVQATQIQAILTAAQSSPEQALISNILLRAMQRAYYAPEYIGHFGLGSAGYCHFTSPIRRYPDLIVHHLLKYQLAGDTPPRELTQQLAIIAEHCSEREQAAEAATREATKQKLAVYLMDQVGQSFTVLVNGVSSLGLFVQEVSTTAEGLISRDSLASGLFYDAEQYCYSDQSGEPVLCLGQCLQVRLTAVDLRLSELDFVLV